MPFTSRTAKASYRNRWIATTESTRERAAGKRLFNSNFSPPPHANLSNTNIFVHGSRFLSLYEGGEPYEVDRNLETHGREPPQTGAFESFARYDLKSGDRVVPRFAVGETVCEPVFVSRPGASVEDDGYVMSFAHEEGKPGGSFVLPDAQRLDAPPLARIRLAPPCACRPARELDTA